MPISVYELKELVEELGSIRGRHTELVTVLIPAGANIYTIADQIAAEQSTADNIKSKTTRKNVIDALETVGRELKKYRQTPANGMALFCGNVSPVEGQEDLKLWVVEPPQSLKTRMYRCDQVFIIDPLREMLEAEEVYGLVVMDKREATIGLLEGKQIKVLRKLTSGVPGKYKTGGQCLSPDTLIMKSDGDLIEIKDSHNPLIVVSENFNKEETEETPVIAKWENNKQLFRIITCYPKLEIKASKEHIFFARTENGIEEKPLSQIKEGDYLIMPEKINLNLEIQSINFSPAIQSTRNLKAVNIPTELNEDLSRVLGYYLGDGSHEIDRLTFFEQRKEVAEFYKELIEKIFGLNIKYKFRESKNYCQLRVYSRIISQFFKQIFPTKDKTLKEKIPSIILKSQDKVLASFIAGFFDAEGYVSSSRIALGINNEFIIKQLQFCLLRLGIISSILHYDNKQNPYSDNIRHTLEISDIESIKNFSSSVKFASSEKRGRLEKLIRERSNHNKVRQIAVNGLDVAKILRNSGIPTTQFMCPDFFINKKQINKELFKERILDKIENPELKKRLELFYNSNLIAVKIFKIEQLEELMTIDIETKSHNFLANGLIVHNSAARFERIREGLAKEFYRKIADSMKECFFDLKKLKGILVGGPIPSKEEFLADGQLNSVLKDKIIAIKDLGYADEHGLETLVKLSQEELSKQDIIREQKILEKFFNRLGKEDKVMYKKEDVEKALKYGAVQLLILSDKLKKAELQELSEKARATSAEIEIVSTETPEGEQFFNLGGIGALLRFDI